MLEPPWMVYFALKFILFWPQKHPLECDVIGWTNCDLATVVCKATRNPLRFTNWCDVITPSLSPFPPPLPNRKLRDENHCIYHDVGFYYVVAQNIKRVTICRNTYFK